MRVVDLRYERLVDPIGLDTPHPRLTWRIEADGDERDVVQTAYEVEVDDWSTGRVESWRQQVTYDGPVLRSAWNGGWRVRVWTSAGPSRWSDWAQFQTGILDPSEWVARMIVADHPTTPVVRFTRTIDVPDDIDSALLRLSAHGIVDATVNGQPVSSEVLAPGWTSYDQRLVVRTHDLKAVLNPGQVELALTVAPGWYSGRIGFRDAGPLYGTHVGVFGQLEIVRAHADRIVIGTDETWTATTTEYSLAEIYDGEDIDEARAGQPVPVQILDSFDPAVLCAPAVPPVRRTEVLQPVSVNGSILDFGQNLVGWLRVRGVPDGRTVTLRHAEILDNDGQLFTAPLRTARATDVFTGGDYEPRFTFHGFRYAEVTGVSPDDVEVEAVVIHSDLERIGTFECSDPLLNRLHENAVWGWRGNSVAVPTDCPQRDERLGWTGDAQVFSPTASFLYDAETFWQNWLADVAADQRADGAVPSVVPDIGLEIRGACGWGDAAVVVPWTTYVAYGDDTVLREALPSMRASVDYVYSRLDADHRWTQDFQYGDWLDPDAPTEQPWRAKARFDLVATAYAAHVADLLARTATVLGEDALAAHSRARFETVRAAWWEHYGDTAATTQTGAALAIAFALVPDDEARFKMGEALALRVHDAGDHLATGFLGTPLLLPSLAATGHLDVAYDVLLQRSAPSWLYTVLAGATTIWERWDALREDGSVPLGSLDIGSGSSMVSYNHYAYGAVAEWLHTAVAGLRPDPDDPGYHHFFVEPRPGGGLTRASAARQTRYGTASVAWRLEGDQLHVDVEVPPNTSATVMLPDGSTQRVGSGVHAFG
ncbi:MAG TPA: family 78 glycoside hydrolase catalytic domain [Acidimicrobiales bacterium]|nr:family 78 glycoside hydrolase catalytic domain [Acidimicrobiales bacterium]